MKKLIFIFLILICMGSGYARDRDIYPIADRSIFKVGVIGPAGQHNILSTVHTDSAVASAARGALLVRNSTPKWARLSLGASGTVLRSDGTDAVWAATTLITTLGTITTGTWNADVITVTYGGTGASSLTDGGILLGSGTGAITALGVASNGQIPIGDGATDPVLATITGNVGIDVTNGVGTITLDFDSTEIDATTWSDSANVSNLWTFDVSGTDTTMLAGSGLMSFSHDIAVLGDNIEATTETDRFVFMANGSTYAPEAIDLGTDTAGNYVASITDGLAIDGGDGGSEGAALTLAFDPTELLGNRTWGDASTDTIVWTWDRATGTDPAITFGNDLFSLANSLTVATGKNITLGSTQWNSADEIDGTKIKDADYGDVDVSAGGAWTVSSVQANSVALATDTTGDFVNSITGGAGIDSTGATSGENISHTLSFDSTEVSGNRTWGDASTDTILWTWNRATGTDPAITFGNNLITLNGDITTTGTGTFGTVSVARLTMNDRTLSGSSFVLFTSPDGFSFDWGGAIGGLSFDDVSGFGYIGDLNTDFDIILAGTGSLDLVGDMDISGTLTVDTIDDSGAGMITIPTKLEISFTETTDGVDSLVELVKTWNKFNPAASTQYGIFNQFTTSTVDWSGTSGAITVYTNYNKLILNSSDMPDSQNSTWNGVYSLIEERAGTHDGGVTESLNAVFGEIDYNPDDNASDIVTGTAGRFIATGTTENVSTMIGVYASGTGGDTNWDIFSATSDSFYTGDIVFGQTDKNERIGSDTVTTLDLYATDNVHSHSNFIIDTGVLFLNETTTPTAVANHGAIYTKNTNELFFQDGAGVEHVIHSDSFSTIWFHGTSTVEVTISAIDTFTLFDSFTIVGKEDDLSNAVGNISTNTITLSSNSGGEYKVTYHGSVTATGGADKEMIFVFGITLATPLDITNVTDDLVSPIVITSVAHGLDNGDMVEIVNVLGNTAANGSFILESTATDTFVIVALDGNATTGNGDYNEGSPTGDVTIEYPGQMVVHRMVRGADLGALSATGIHELADSDVISLYVANVSGTTNLTVAAVSLGLDRIGD